MGRKTEFTENRIDQAKEYLAGCIPEIENYEKTVGEKSTSFQRIVHPNLPKMCGLAVYMKVNKDTLYSWAKVDSRFADVLDDIMEEQEHRLLEGGLSGDYNPLISKLILSARHEYREKSDVTTSGDKLAFNTEAASSAVANFLDDDEKEK
jgi:hypothetical protein